jgi:hypothetical protein
LKDAANTGLIWFKLPTGANRCMLLNQPITELQANPDAATAGAILETRVPKGAGTWGDFPACSCGVDHVTRTCASGTCVGPSTLKCPAVSCVYDQFDGLMMSAP